MHNNEIKKRAKTLFLNFIILFVILISYYFIVRYTPLLIPCLFFELTGLNCPGCGITRMLTRFLQFNFAEGITFNYFLGFTLPIIIFIILMMSYYYIYNKKYSKWFNILLYIYLAALIIWWIVRNIIGI